MILPGENQVLSIPTFAPWMSTTTKSSEDMDIPAITSFLPIKGSLMAYTSNGIFELNGKSEEENIIPGYNKISNSNVILPFGLKKTNDQITGLLTSIRNYC
jgi:hypothetical protein